MTFMLNAFAVNTRYLAYVERCTLYVSISAVSVDLVGNVTKLYWSRREFLMMWNIRMKYQLLTFSTASLFSAGRCSSGETTSKL